MINRSGFFKWNAPSGSDSVLQPWYDGLSVKPSAGLWSDLKTMADGMDEDGDWDKFDHVHVFAALENDEQRLRPFKSQLNIDVEIVGGVTLDVNGFTGNGTNGYVKTKFTPSNATNFQVNDCFISYYNSSLSTNNRFTMGVLNYFSLRVANGGNIVNVNNIANQVFAHNMDLGYKAAYFHGDQITRYYHAGVEDSLSPIAMGSLNRSTKELYLFTINNNNVPLGSYANNTLRHLILGSGSINNLQVKSRLETFYAARGLATY